MNAVAQNHAEARAAIQLVVATRGTVVGGTKGAGALRGGGGGGRGRDAREWRYTHVQSLRAKRNLSTHIHTG